jgi:hypothetical protein
LDVEGYEILVFQRHVLIKKYGKEGIDIVWNDQKDKYELYINERPVESY